MVTYGPYGAAPADLRAGSTTIAKGEEQMGSPFIGVDVQGVQTWQAQLNAAHDQVIAALNHYRAIAQENSRVAHGSQFDRLNVECENITNKHESDHDNLHAEYTKASNNLVQGIIDIAN